MAVSHHLHGLLSGALAASFVLMPPGAIARGAQQDAPPAQRADPDQVRTVCTLIRREIGRLPRNVSIEDAEAAIVFALSQANAGREVTDQALTCAAGGNVTANVRQAIENVRRSYTASGTGALRRGGGGNGGASPFSAPILGIGGGGGGSNYAGN